MDSLGLYDIYDYWYIPFWQTNSFKVIVILMGLVLLISLILFVLRKIMIKRSLDLWVSWHTVLNVLRKKQVDTKKFYSLLTQMLKELAITQLNASHGITDVELSLFYKNEAFPPEVTFLGDLIDQATVYKF